MYYLRHFLLVGVLVLGAYFSGELLNSKTTTQKQVLGTAEMSKQTNLDNLSNTIRSWQNNLPAKSAIYISNLRTGQTIKINENTPITSASLYKLFTAYVLLEIEDQKPGFINQRLDDGQKIRDCLRQMIIVSDNECSEVLGNLAGWQNTDDKLRTLGLMNTSSNYNARGNLNGIKFTSSYDVGIFLEKLYKGDLLTRGTKNYFIKQLLDQELNDLVPDSLPDGVFLAHKTGSLEDIRHDAGYIIDRGRDDYVYVIMTYGWDKEDADIPDQRIKSFLNQLVNSINS